MAIQYKLFDLYTRKYILDNPNDPESYLTETVEGSLLEAILPPEAATKLSLANIEMGMGADMINQNHPDSANNVLLMNRGSRGLFGPPEYKAILDQYLDTTIDYPYHRYLSNENEKLVKKEIKVWVIDDEEALSGLDSVSSEQAGVILGDSHGKISLDLAQELIPEVETDGVVKPLGKTSQLIQHRMVGTNNKFFAKGTFQASLANTLKKHQLEQNLDLQDLDMILPTSSIKGATKKNLPPGVHTVEVLVTNHKLSKSNSYTMRAVTEKFKGDSLAWGIKQQTKEVEQINQTSAHSDKLFADFVKYLEPKHNADGTDFDPDNWRNCGDTDYILARQDLESGHYQFLTSNVFAERMNEFYASRGRKSAQLQFVKAKGGMIYCSHDLKNGEICVPGLAEGEKLAAVRSPIINLQDIAIVKNRHIPDMYNDAGETMAGAIICSPQDYAKYMGQTRNFVAEQTKALEDAGIDVSYLNQLNSFNLTKYQSLTLSSLAGAEKQELIEGMNAWREEYNSLIKAHQSDVSSLGQIRLDTFTAILAADFDGDNIAIVPQSKYPEFISGIEDRTAEADSYTIKLDKMKVEAGEDLATVLARKADPYIVGKTANLAELLQGLAIESERVKEQGNLEAKQNFLKQIAPAYYYMLAQPTSQENQQVKKGMVSFRDYKVSSTGERLLDDDLVAQFDLYSLGQELPQVLNGKKMQEAEIDRALVLWQKTLLKINDKVALQNQIAVDSFKSERPVDNDLVEGLGKRLKSLNDGLKKSLADKETYLSTIPEVKNRVTNRSLFVGNVNQNLVPFQVGSTPYERIQNVFPQVEQEDIKHQVDSAINEYKRYRRLAGLYRTKETQDQGPSMVFRHNNREIEVSNLLYFGHEPQSLQKLTELSTQNLEMRVVKSKIETMPHEYLVQHRLVNNKLDQQTQWENLGTLCSACQDRYGIEAEELGQVPHYDFVTPSGAHLAKSYKERQLGVIQSIQETAGTDRQTYAAAAYNILTKSSSKHNNLDFMFDAFGPELIEAASEFKLTNLGINHLQELPYDSGEKVNITIERDEANPDKFALLAVKDGKQTQVGLLADTSFHPRLGMQAEAIINYGDCYTGKVTLADGSSFALGTMNKADLAGQIFLGQDMEIELAMSKPKKLPVFKIGKEVVGIIDPETTLPYLEKNNLLKAGLSIPVSLTSYGVGSQKKIVATAANGIDTFNITKSYFYGSKNMKERMFQDESVEITIGFSDVKPVLTAYTQVNGQRQSLGMVLNNKRYAEAHQVIAEHKLENTTFKASVNSNLSTVDVVLDPETIVYPQESRNLFRDRTEETEVDFAETNPQTQAFLEQAATYESLAHYQDRPWINGEGEVSTVASIDILIDNHSALTPGYIEQLEALGFQAIDVEGDDLSKVKGFTTYSLPSDRLSQVDFYQLQQDLKINQVYDSGLDQGATAKLAQYLNDRFSNIEPTTGELEVDLAISLPNLDFVPQGNQAVIPEGNLVELIKTKELLSDLEAVKLAQSLDRYDYQWLNNKLDSELSSAHEVIEAISVPETLTQLQEQVNFYVTPEEEIVYQHIKNATDKRYEEEMTKVWGDKRVDLYRGNVQALINEDITPILALSGRTPSEVGEMSANRPGNYIVRLPEAKGKLVQPGIELGQPDHKLSMALSNPQDVKNPDNIHPLNYDGVNYESIQAAYQALESTVDFRKRYELTGQLLQAKLIQYPEIVKEIDQNGGSKWIYANSYDNGNDFMSSKGKNGFIHLVNKSYKAAQQQLEAGVESKATPEQKRYIEKPKLDQDGIYTGINIASRSNSPLGAALANTTEKSKYWQKIKQSYPVSFRDNPFRDISMGGKSEKYPTEKPAGTPFVSAEDAYQHFSPGLDDAGKVELMAEILEAKLLQHPKLAQTISGYGGATWLAKCDHVVSGKDELWEGNGTQSGFIKALTKGYEKAIEREPTLNIGLQTNSVKLSGQESDRSATLQSVTQKTSNSSVDREVDQTVVDDIPPEIMEAYGAVDVDAMIDNQPVISGEEKAAFYEDDYSYEENISFEELEAIGESKTKEQPTISAKPNVKSTPKIKAKPVVEKETIELPPQEKSATVAPTIPLGLLNIPASQQNTGLKNYLKKIMDSSGFKGVTNDAVEVVKSQLTSQAENSFVATYKSSDTQAIAFNAASLGQEMQQDKMTFFVADAQGQDHLYGITLDESIESSKETLDMAGLTNYTLIPAGEQTKVMVINPSIEDFSAIEYIAQDYGQFKIFPGKQHEITKEQYPAIIKGFNSSRAKTNQVGVSKDGHRRGERSNHHGRGYTVETKLQAIPGLDPAIIQGSRLINKFVGFNPGNDPQMEQIIAAFDDRANTGEYTNKDKVMMLASSTNNVSLKAIKQSFKADYLPELDKIIAANAKVLVPLGTGITNATLNYLKKAGYQVKDSGKGYAQSWQQQQAKSAPVIKNKQNTPLKANPVNTAEVLAKSAPDLTSVVTKQHRLAQAAAPKLVSILNKVESYRHKCDRYSINYDPKSKTISLSDLSSQKLLMSAVQTKDQWQSTTNSLTMSEDVIKDIQAISTAIRTYQEIPGGEKTEKPEIQNQNRFEDLEQSASLDADIARAEDYAVNYER